MAELQSAPALEKEYKVTCTPFSPTLPPAPTLTPRPTPHAPTTSPIPIPDPSPSPSSDPDPKPGPNQVTFTIPVADRELRGTLIQMAQVGFSYTAGAPRLMRNLDFELSMDSRVALVGPNGCGASASLEHTHAQTL